MASKLQWMLLFAAAVGCQSKPFQWGGGTRTQFTVHAGAKASGQAAAGVQGGELGGGGDVNGDARLHASGNLVKYAYVSGGRPGDEEASGLGFYSDTHAEAGGRLSGRAGGDVGGGAGAEKRPLGAHSGSALWADLTPDAYGSVGGDAHFMTGAELQAMANRERANALGWPRADTLGGSRAFSHYFK